MEIRTVNKPGVGYIDEVVDASGPWIKPLNGTEVKNSSSGLKMDSGQAPQRLSGRKLDLDFSRSSATRNLYGEGCFGDGPQFLVTKQSTGRRHTVITREMQELSRARRQFSEPRRGLTVQAVRSVSSNEPDVARYLCLPKFLQRKRVTDIPDADAILSSLMA